MFARMADFSPAYRELLAFLGSLYYTDFNTVTYGLIQELLQEAGVAYTQGAYMSDVWPYTTPVLEIGFEVRQVTGHVNEVRLTFIGPEHLSDLAQQLTGMHLLTRRPG